MTYIVLGGALNSTHSLKGQRRERKGKGKELTGGGSVGPRSAPPPYFFSDLRPAPHTHVVNVSGATNHLVVLSSKLSTIGIRVLLVSASAKIWNALPDSVVSASSSTHSDTN